jgi:hypothetical protein
MLGDVPANYAVPTVVDRTGYNHGFRTAVNDDFHLFGTHGHGWGYKYPHGGYAGYLSENGVRTGQPVMGVDTAQPHNRVLVGRPHGSGYYYPQGTHGYGGGFGQNYGHGTSYPYGMGHTWPNYYANNYTHGGIFGMGPQPYPHHHQSYHSGTRHARYNNGNLISN